MGVSAFPHCGGGIVCWPINHLTKALVYTESIQSTVGPAGYFRDAANLDKYLEKSHFLPDLNNERNPSQARKERVILKILILDLKSRRNDACKVHKGYYDSP